MKLVQFGAGKIGRSLVGKMFAAAGWEVVFVDILPDLVDRLNERQRYDVVVKREGRADEVCPVGPVRAVDGRNASDVVGEFVDADIVATSVGKAAFPDALNVIAAGITERERTRATGPLNIIIAENARGADAYFRSALGARLGAEFPLADRVGIVQASIDKMVPLMRAEDLAEDPLRLFAEDHDSLVADGRGFRGEAPRVAGLVAVDDIGAYVDRKLFMHNLAHAATAYLGFAADPSVALLAEALALPGVERTVRTAMAESAEGLLAEYPGLFSRPEMIAHIDDLIFRFKNRALGDTVHRVGRDLYRKLGRDDRLVGAMLLCARHGLPFGAIATSYRAALEFAAPDETGLLFDADARFRTALSPSGTEAVLRRASGLDPADATDAIVIDEVLGRSRAVSPPFSRESL